MLVRPLRVAVLATNNARDYSGGRYHGLMAAYALAAAGADVRFITNRRPVFLEDLEGLAPGAVTAETTNDWNAELAGGSLDYVVVVPTGIFHPEFYEAALSLAADSGARIVLINFESGNWFNEMAPEPRDTALWDYWRRLVAEGGLVLSSARTSDIRARQFYASQGAQLRFEVWSPAINSVAARQHDDAPFHDGVVAFVRSTDGHKGALDLLQLDPAILEGRTLHIVAGNDHDPGFIRELRDRFVGGGGGVEFHVRPHDDDKFRLLSGAKALVFPSRFEGFGYPPVEAAFAGAEIAAYDLPVLRETVGSIAHFAPRGDVEALGRALVEALAAPPRRALVRAAVETRVDFAIASSRLCDILWRNLEAVRPRAPRGFRILWGPPRDTMPRRQDDFDPLPTDLPMPEEALECRWSRAGEVLLSLRLRTTIGPRLHGTSGTPAPLPASADRWAADRNRPAAAAWYRAAAPKGFGNRAVRGAAPPRDCATVCRIGGSRRSRNRPAFRPPHAPAPVVAAPPGPRPGPVPAPQRRLSVRNGQSTRRSPAAPEGRMRQSRRRRKLLRPGGTRSLRTVMGRPAPWHPTVGGTCHRRGGGHEIRRRRPRRQNGLAVRG